jgi:hypothetical protein
MVGFQNLKASEAARPACKNFGQAPHHEHLKALGVVDDKFRLPRHNIHKGQGRKKQTFHWADSTVGKSTFLSMTESLR